MLWSDLSRVWIAAVVACGTLLGSACSKKESNISNNADANSGSAGTTKGTIVPPLGNSVPIRCIEEPIVTTTTITITVHYDKVNASDYASVPIGVYVVEGNDPPKLDGHLKPDPNADPPESTYTLDRTKYPKGISAAYLKWKYKGRDYRADVFPVVNKDLRCPKPVELQGAPGNSVPIKFTSRMERDKTIEIIADFDWPESAPQNRLVKFEVWIKTNKPNDNNHNLSAFDAGPSNKTHSFSVPQTYEQAKVISVFLKWNYDGTVEQSQAYPQ